MRLLVNDEAVNDLEAIRTYISEDNAQAAEKMVNELIDGMLMLTDFCESGMKLENHTRRRNDYRFKIVKPYLIFYRIESDAVRVYRILHASTGYIKLLGL